jgi:hypothetical protein
MGEPAVTITEPTQPWRQSFVIALVDGYPTWEAMSRLTYVGLGQHIEALVIRAPLPEAASKLLEWANGTSRLPELVRAAVSLAPSHVALRTCAKEMGWEPLGTDPQVQVENVGIALRLLTRDPNVRVALAGFHAVFESADRRLQRVMADKTLHDRLHDFYILCYVPLKSLARTFPLGETHPQLRLETLTYKRELEKIRAVVSVPPLSTDELDWVADNLTPAYDLLVAAAAEPSLAKLQQALRLISMVVEVQPTVVNEKLIRAVENLDLDALVRNLGAVQARLTGPNDDDELSPRVARAVEDLRTLHAELARLVASHRDWQKVDNAMRVFDSSVDESSLVGLEPVWKIVDRAVQRVLTDQEPWTTELREVGVLVAAAVANPQHGSIAMFFRRFQSLAGARFYQVDKDVKLLCDRLAPIGTPLDEFVAQLNDGHA